VLLLLPLPPRRSTRSRCAQVERVLVATNRALYRCAFSYKEGTLGEARRTEWSTYAQVHVGPFKYKARAPLAPSRPRA
jgi:hypothetical protein